VTDRLLGFAVFELNSFEATHLLVEAWSLHADLIVIDLILADDVALDSNGTGGINVIASYHANSYTCLLNAPHSTGYFLAHSVLDTDDRDKGESISFDILDVFLNWLVVAVTVFAFFDVLVRYSHGTKSILCVGLDVVGDGLEYSVVTGLTLSILIDVVGTSAANNF